MNALDVIEGKAKASRDLIQHIASMGAQAFHRQWADAMYKAGWRIAGRHTNYDLLHTAHIRRWELLVDAQRAPLLALEGQRVEAEWDATDDGGAE